MTKIKNWVLLLTILLIGVIGTWFISDLQYKSTAYNEAKYWIEHNEKVKALNQFEEIKGFRDTDKRIKGLYEEMYSFVKEKIKSESYGNYFLNGYIYKLKDNPIYKEEMEELEILIQDEKEKKEAQRIEKLKFQEPYLGMSEGDIKYTSWGEPTEINKSRDYNSMRSDRRHLEYKWIEKDSLGRIVKIKVAYVQKGKIYIEPNIHEYYR